MVLRDDVPAVTGARHPSNSELARSGFGTANSGRYASTPTLIQKFGDFEDSHVVVPHDAQDVLRNRWETDEGETDEQPSPADSQAR